MPDKSKRPGAAPANSMAEKISLTGKLAPEVARRNIRALLLGNPNYFGTLTDSKLPSVMKIKNDTAYESIGCVGYNPQLSRLEAEVNIKRDTGYDGGVCTNGSIEYVRFYLSHDGGATWKDQGITSFRVYDTPGPKPLEYDASLQINPAEWFCFAENLPTVRAILSWNVPPHPNAPHWTPVWGQVVDTHIQIAGLHLLPLKDLLQEAKLTLAPQFEEAVDLAQPIKAAEAAPLSALELAKLYEKSNVPGHRYLFPELQKAIAGPALAQPAFGIEGLNLASILEAALNTKGDTRFEQLNCVGLNPNIDQLVAILNVKLSSGYSGGPCSAGSKEYVAFWVDWDGTGFTYVGTNSVTVHDYSSIPPGGLQYSVIQPVDMVSHRVPCEKGAKTARVRAVLSWNTPPSTVDPYAPVVWGNSHETTILLEPGTPVAANAGDISIIGGIGLAGIDHASSGLTLPYATFANFGPGEYADPWDHSRQCPFGGMVDVHGQPALGMRYRVKVRLVGFTTPAYLTSPIYPVDKFGVTHTVTPDASGFFPYLPQDQNQLSLLAYWYSSGDELWEMALEVADGSDNVLGQTPWYRIQLDNTAPKTSAQLVPPTIDIHIDSGGDCKDFGVAAEIDGHFVARDLHFGAWSLTTLPTTITPPPNQPVSFNPAISATTQTEVYPGHQWKLDTTGMTPCGYVVVLQVWDRSIVGSYPGSHNYNEAQVGFCLRTPA